MKNRRLFWRIVEKIEHLIDSGIYPPGSRLPPERELADNYGVSRPTIREAIIALEVRERVEVKTGSGIYVAENQSAEKSAVKISAFELTQARALVEGEAAALAATTITEEELAALHQTLVDMENEANAEDADEQFHLIISKATRNNAILVAVEKLWHLRSNLYPAVASQINQWEAEQRLQRLAPGRQHTPGLTRGEAQGDAFHVSAQQHGLDPESLEKATGIVLKSIC